MFEKLLITKNVCEKVCQWSIRLLCAVMFFPVANVFGTELDRRFMFIFPTSSVLSPNSSFYFNKPNHDVAWTDG